MFLLAQLPSLHSGAHSFLPDQNSTSESDQSSVDCCKMPSLQLLNCWTCLIIKCWKYNPHERRCSSGWSVCVFARVCVCVCVCVRARRAPKQTSKVHFELRARPNDQIHTKHVKTDGLESIHINTVYILVNENSWEKIVCQYFVSVTDWSFIKEQNTKTKSLTALNLNKVITLISINLSIYTVKTMQCSFIFDHF